MHPAYGGKIIAQAYDTAAFKLVADDLLQSARANILFHAFAVGVAMRSETVIDAILIESKWGREAIRAGAFIDCSGDADLARWAGAPYEQSNKPGGTYYTSHMFRMSDVNAATAAGDRQLIPKLMAEAESRGEERFPRKGAIVNPIVHKSEWYENATQQKKPDGSALDATNVDDLTYGSSKGGGRSGRSSTSSTRTCRISSGPTSSIFRHRSAFARHAASSAAISCRSTTS